MVSDLLFDACQEIKESRRQSDSYADVPELDFTLAVMGAMRNLLDQHPDGTDRSRFAAEVRAAWAAFEAALGAGGRGGASTSERAALQDGRREAIDGPGARVL
jgi:hypothetical protein